MQEPVATTASEFDRVVAVLLRRYAYIDRRNIIPFTEQFCDTFQLNGIPRNPFTLLPEHFGIKIRRSPRPSHIPAQWMLCSASDRYVIYTGDYRVGRRLVLTLYHELFEIIASNRAFPTRLGSSEECELGWQFATNLTMPEEAVRSMASEFGHPSKHDKTGVLAGRFYVSISAMRLRLKSLGIAPEFTARKY